MGYDIKIVDVLLEGGRVKKYRLVGETCLSSNWDDCQWFCPSHLTACQCEEEEKIKLWHVTEDCLGFYGYEIKERAQRALNLLIKHDIDVADVSENICAHFGLIEDSRERWSMFAYHLSRFVSLGDQYETFLFCSHD